jgi:hypothetical protein
MRKLIAAAGALMLMSAGALAAVTEGEIRQVDLDALTIVLDDGKTYRLPPEIDMSVIAEGITVTIDYEARDGVNQIMDMFIQ